MKTLCVFSGSNFGRLPEYAAAARRLGTLLADRGIDLVYGGGNVGLMGEVSRAVLEKGGRAVGVIPEYIRSRVPHVDLSELIVTPGMHERKAMMYELSDGFIALPGGVGTLEETAEIFTWGQLGHHGKPVGLLNVEGYYDSLLVFFRHAVSEGFLKKTHFENLIVEADPAVLLDRFAGYRHVRESKWHAESR
jgi:hypothetical protein